MLVYAATKGGDQHPDGRAVEPARPEGHPGQLRRSRPGLDADPADREEAEQIEQLGADTPLGRAGQPAELAPAYVLLASREGSYMTGALVPVTGGQPML